MLVLVFYPAVRHTLLPPAPRSCSTQTIPAHLKPLPPQVVYFLECDRRV